jgi:hypothetical protein
MAQGQQHELSFTDVSRAVSLVTGLPPELQEIVNLSGRVHSKIVSDPNLRTAQLGQENIKSLIFSNMPPEVLDLMDPAKRAEVQRIQAERNNATGSAYAQAFAVSGTQGALTMRDGARGTGSRETSARFDSVANVKGDWNSPAGQSYMRDFAIQHGVPWAANNPDILRLGPSAITAMADVRLRQETFQRMTKDGQFKAKDVVTMSKFAKKEGIDANDLGNSLVDSNRALATDHNGRVDHKKLEELRKAEMDVMAKPDDRAAKERLQKVLERDRADPAKKPHVETIENKLRLQKDKEHGAANKSNIKEDKAQSKERKAEADQSGAEASLSALNGSTEGTAASKGQPKTEKASAAEQRQTPASSAKPKAAQSAALAPK